MCVYMYISGLYRVMYIALLFYFIIIFVSPRVYLIRFVKSSRDMGLRLGHIQCYELFDTIHSSPVACRCNGVVELWRAIYNGLVFRHVNLQPRYVNAPS